MWQLGPLAFAAPWLLLALPALPLLWWLLRVSPPAPRTQAFPAIRLLRDLPPVEETPHRTPWWLLLLRLVAAALLVLGLARPVWQPQAGGGGEGPLLLVIDDGWAAAPDWPARMASAAAALDAAAREGRRVALLPTAPPASGEALAASALMPAEEARARLAALRPRPWAPDHAAAITALAAFRAAHPGPLAALWVADGIEHAAEGAAAGRLGAALAEAGPLTLARAEARPTRILPPPRAEADRLVARVLQAPMDIPTEATVLARTGDGRAIASATLAFPPGATSAEAALDLPIEIRNQVVRLDLEPEAGAAGTVLLDERFRRRPVGLSAAIETSADAPLTGDLFYLDRALAPYAEIRRGPPEALLARRLAVLVLADREVPEGREREALTRWVEEGGTLIRFAGPRLAERPDPLLPVRAAGGRAAIGRRAVLGPAADAGPLPGRLALRGPDAAGRGHDRTPGAGRALAAPDRTVLGAAVGWHAAGDRRSRAARGGSCCSMSRPMRNGRTCRCRACSWTCCGASSRSRPACRGRRARRRSRRWKSLDGFGRLGPAPPAAAPIPANRVEETVASPRHPPGWYGTAGQAEDAAWRRALNLSAHLPPPRAAAAPPPGARVEASAACRGKPTSAPGCWRWRCCCWWWTCWSRWCCAGWSGRNGRAARGRGAARGTRAALPPARSRAGGGGARDAPRLCRHRRCAGG
jgi:hypothetical protein